MRTTLIALLLGSFVVLGWAGDEADKGEAEDGDASRTALAVQVREALLRAKPSFLGRIVDRVPYQTLVAVEEAPKGSLWRRVRRLDAPDSGWLQQSALHADPVALKAGTDRPTRADATTRSLAGRGFNEKVEANRRGRLRAAGSSIEQGYFMLDTLLKRSAFNADPDDVEGFVIGGGLEGGAR